MEQRHAAAQERFDRVRQRLDAARNGRDRTGTLLIAGGLCVLAAAVSVHLSHARGGH